MGRTRSGPSLSAPQLRGQPRDLAKLYRQLFKPLSGLLGRLLSFRTRFARRLFLFSFRLKQCGDFLGLLRCALSLGETHGKISVFLLFGSERLL